MTTFYVLNLPEYRGEMKRMIKYIESQIKDKLIKSNGTRERAYSGCIEIKINGGNITIDEYRKANNLDDWIGQKDEPI